jgi:hypothetical protein
VFGEAGALTMARADTGYRDEQGRRIYAGDRVRVRGSSWSHMVARSVLFNRWEALEITPSGAGGAWELTGHTVALGSAPMKVLLAPPFTDVPLVGPTPWRPARELQFDLPRGPDRLFM